MALPLVRPEDSPLPSNMAACAILTGSCPAGLSRCPTLVFGPALPRWVLSWVPQASFTLPLLAGGFLVQECGGGAARTAPCGEGWGCSWQLPFWASPVSFAPTPALVGGSPGLGRQRPTGSGPGTFPAVAGAWGRGGEPLGWEIGVGKAGTCGLSCLLGRLFGTGIWGGERGGGCPQRGACCELSALCLHSLPGDKKGSPPPAATAKSQFSLRRRQVLRGKSGPGLKKTPPKGLMQATRHRPSCLPPGRAHLPKEGRRTGQGFWGGRL